MLLSTKSQLSLLIALGVALIGLAGCDSTPTQPNFGSEDGRAVAILIEEFNETGGDTKKISEYFETTPKDTKGYGKYMYSIDGKPKISGTTATAQVKISTDGGEEKGTKEWSFTKVGEAWKIKDAPLP